PLSVETVIICEKPENCTSDSPDVFRTDLIYQSDSRKFFRSQASALLERGLQIAFVAYSAQNTISDIRFIEFDGGPDPVVGSANQATSNLPGNAGQVSNAVSGESLVTTNCAGAGCHSSPLPYTKAQSLQAVQSGLMPKNR